MRKIILLTSALIASTVSMTSVWTHHASASQQGQDGNGLPHAGPPLAGQPQAGPPPADQPQQAGLPPADQPQAGPPPTDQPQAGLPPAGQPQAGPAPTDQRQAGLPPAGQPQAGPQRLGQEASLQASTILHISPAGVRQIQQALNKQGYDAGHVDGHWNPQTSTAVKNFQQMQGLQPTGQLTTETLGALGLGSLLQGQGLGQAGQVSQWLVQEAAANPGTPLWVSPAGVRQIQQALNKQGYDAGHIDGQWNPQTSTAVKNFQQMQGLEPTGNLDIRTIVALGLKDVLTGQGGNQAGQWLAQEAARGGGTQLHISSAEVRQIQQALDQMGYKIRNIDGQWNPQTATALKNFQQAQGLEPTGNLNTVTISALRLSNVLAGEVGAGGQEQTAQQQGGQMGGVQPSDQRLTQERASGGIPGIASGDQQQGGTTMIGGSINGGQAGAGSQTQMGGQTQPGTQGTVSGQIGIGAQGSQPITKKRQSSGTTIYWIKPEVVQK